MNLCPHLTRIAIPPFRQIVRQREVLIHTQGRSANTARGLNSRNQVFTIKYALLYEIDEIF